jgi:phosphoenolpyruvate carboxylase
MSTQHPDNVAPPVFTDHPVLRGEDEIREAYYAYSHLGCTEQMWDYEGKEVDGFVVKKLLSRYATFFADRRLGETLFLTLRVPNPRVEVAEAKVLAETLESIPRSYDAARTVHGDEVPAPIFEVILPMTSSSEEMNRVYHYYRRFVASKGQERCHDLSLGDWLGAFRPSSIQVIPLIEDREHLLEADRIVDSYVEDKNLPWQRVFLARSDPALNYGQIGAVLLLKVALQRLAKLEERLDIPLYPILGAGSAPFRGNLRPGRIDETLTEYPSVQTFTVQSAFKYDYAAEEARGAIARLNETSRAAAREVDETGCIELIDKVSARYAACVEALAPLVNALAAHVPQRRARRLHIGLFGYSRRLEGCEGVHLPRAIRFCAALYSIGLPPEVLGFGALSRSELARVRDAYVTIDHDMEDSLRFLCEENVQHLPPVVREEVSAARDAFACEPSVEHAGVAERIWTGLRNGEPNDVLTAEILRAAAQRRFLG